MLLSAAALHARPFDAKKSNRSASRVLARERFERRGGEDDARNSGHENLP